MPRVWFEPTSPVFERTNTIHALDRAASDRRFQINRRVYGIMSRITNIITILNFEIKS
jgi:hypothetical protein